MKQLNIKTNKIDFENLPTPVIEKLSNDDINNYINEIDKKEKNITKNITKNKKIQIKIPDLDFSKLSTPNVHKKSDMDIKQYIQNVEKFYYC